MISKRKEIFTELVDERFEEIADVDKKVNNDNLIYRYKARIPNAKFDKLDNALDILNKMRNGKIGLSDVKNNQAKFKSNLDEVRKAHKKRKNSKTTPCIILKCFTKQRTRLLNFIMIIFQWYLKQNLKQLKEQDLNN